MDNKEFKKIVGTVLKKNGFELEKKVYYIRSEQVIVSLDFQKSNFDDSFFINYGFTLVKINPDVTYPKPHTSDVSGRFSYFDEDEEFPQFDLDKVTPENLEKSIELNLENNIKPVIQDGLMEYFEINPAAKFVAKLNVKQYLGLDE